MTAPTAPTVGDLLDASTTRLAAAGVPDPRREAAFLLGHVLGCDRGLVLARRADPVDASTAGAIGDLVAARAGRRPAEHLVGGASFHGLTLEVSPAVLIPRPETELLVDAVLAADLPRGARVADLGTGSGAIAIALLAARSDLRVEALDRSPDALEIALRNAVRHGVADRLRLHEADFDRVRALGGAGLDAVVSNPPYVSEEEWRELAPEVRDHEPRLALVPGPTGHEAYARIAPAAAAGLRAGGLLALELGWRSEAAARALVADAGFACVDVRPDLAGIPRVLTARR